MTTRLDAEPERADVAAATREIETLANSNIPEQRFFTEFLDRVVQTTDARAGAVWMLDQNGLLSMHCDVQFTELGLGDGAVSNRLNIQRLLDVVQTGEATIVAPEEGRQQDADGGSVLLLVPIRDSDRAAGVVELFFDSGTSLETRLDHLQLVEELSGYASRYLGWRKEAGSTASHLEFWNRFERTLVALHCSLNPAEVAATAVNEGRQLLGCDRVSVAIKQGRKTKILAISGQDRVTHRSNLVRQLRTVTTKVVAAGQPVLYAGTPDDVPPALETPMTEYIRESGSRMVKVIPLKGPKPLLQRQTKKTNPTPRALGAVVIEQVSDGWLTPLVAERAEMFAEHVGEAMANALSHENLFLLPVWRFLGRCFGGLRGRNSLKVLVGLSVIAAVILSLAAVPAAYRVEGTGKLMPVVQREAFAPWDGEVVEIFVGSGEHVEQDQELVRLRNDELNTQLLGARSKHDEKRRLLGALQAEADEANRRSSRSEEIRLRGKLAQTRVEVHGLSERIAALEKQVDQLTVRSPIAGTVATFQLEQLLLNRPVRRGDVLLEIMNEEGPWQLELEVPEYRLGHMLSGQTKLATSELPVEFVLATAPELCFQGRLKETSTRTELSEEQGTVVDVLVTADRDELPNRRIGAEVKAKIACGNRSLAYVLFGDLVEFVQKRFW